MINPSLRRKRFELGFESKKCGFVMRIESGRRKIINHGFVQGQGNPPRVKDLQRPRPGKLVVDFKSLTLGWISLSLYKAVVDSYILW